MKKLLFSSLVVVFAITATKAQTITKQIPVNNKPVTMQQQVGRTIPVPKLPDLRITSLNVKQITNSTGGKYLEISYTIKNDGTNPVDKSKIGLDGSIIRAGGGCGASITSSSGTWLNPGESYNGSFKCFRDLDYTVYKYYTLVVTCFDWVQELDATNNSATATTTIMIQ